MIIYFFLAMFLSLVVNCISIKLRFGIKSVSSLSPDRPQDIHSAPVSRMGGLGIFVGFVLMEWELVVDSVVYRDIIIASCIVFLSGFLEDLFGVFGPRIRLFIQTIGVIYGIVCVGVLLYDLNIGFILPGVLAFLFSVFCVVGCVNSINIIDGLNGLSAGVSFMILTSVSLVGYLYLIEHVYLSALVLAGGIFGFIVLNYPRGLIFLGDGGAYLIGFVIALLLVDISQNTPVSSWYGFSLMLYPVWEVLFSIYRRKRYSRNAMSPDNRHLHQLVMRYVGSNAQATLLIWIFYLPFVVASTFYYDDTLSCLLISALFIVMYTSLYSFLSARV